MTTFRGQVPEIGRCKCGNAVRADSFRTSDGIRRFRVSGRCEPCRALAFHTERSGSGCDASAPLISGAVLGLPLGGWRAPEPLPDRELCLIPFQFSSPQRWWIWDFREIVRVGGSSLEKDDRWDDLLAAADAVRDHQCRMRDFATVDDPALLDEAARLDVLVAPGAGWLRRALDLMPIFRDTAHVDLGTLVAWERVAGVPLLPLPRFAWSQGHHPYGFGLEERFSSLRAAAVLVAALESARPLPSTPRPIDRLFDWLETDNNLMRKS